MRFNDKGSTKKSVYRKRTTYLKGLETPMTK